jgi:TonB-linked SusC/RagA family outer membrane protein
MKKKVWDHARGIIFPGANKILLKMKLTLCIILFSFLGAMATDLYSQTTKLSLDLKNTSVKEVLGNIENQSEFFFLYSEKIINVNREINIEVRGSSIEKILDKIFAGTNINYTVKGRQIVLTTPEANPFDTTSSSHQQKSITGKVTDISGTPLPGVSVVIKGTTSGTITDAEGNYTMSNTPTNAIIQFSFVGMKVQEVKIAGKTTLNIKLEEETIGLDEVVAVGYGTVKKQDLTGSVSKIKSEALEGRAITSLAEAFAGQLAGIKAQQTSGKPGAELNIKIRGTSTINASNAPLYVIDGIPGDMKDLNPNDVASIEILKDASSSAIYGARGAAGVVLVTTKNGKKGLPTFNFDAYYGLQKVDKVLDVMNRDEYIAFNIWGRNEAYLRTGGKLTDPQSMRPTANQIPDSWSNPETLPDVDWQDAIYRIAPIQSYQLSASGGGDMGTFLISGSYLDQKGIMEETGYKRATFRLNTTLNIGQHLKLGMNIAPSFSKENNPDDDGYGSAPHFAANMPAIVPLNSNTQDWGYTAGSFSFVNPLERLKETHQETLNNKVLTNVWGELSLSKSLSFKSQYGYNFREARSSYFKPANVNSGSASSGYASVSDWYSWSLQNTMTYSPKISSLFDMNLLLGQSVEGAKYYYNYGAASGYPNDLIYTLNVASTPSSAKTTESENRMASFFSRLNFNVRDRYLLTVNIRRDGSSKFGNDTKWGWFPSASLGWKINKEEFLNSADWLDLLKLRLSLGKAGNNSIGDYESISLLGIANYTLNNAIVSGLAPSSIGNPDLGWETQVSKGVGLDIGVFRNRIQANLDYYNNTTKDMLLNVSVPYISGYTSMRKNIGEVQNKGWEFELTTHNIEGRFSWTSSFNISKNINEVKKLGPDNAPIISDVYGYTAYITKVGEAIGSYYMYKTDGLLLDKDFDSNGNATVAIAAGQEKGNVKIVDLNKDGKINANDLTVVGNNQPKFVWGFTNRFSYKNFDLNILLQGTQGGEVFFVGSRHMDCGQIQGMNQLKRWVHSYKPDRSTGENPFPQNSKVDLSWDGKTMNRFGNNPWFNDTWIYDGSFVRVKNITLGYNFTKELCRRIGIQGARVYMMGDNVFTWNHYPGATPETNSDGNETTQPGADYGTYPLARKYSLGISLTF